MLTTTEDKLIIGDVFRPRRQSNGFMTMVVTDIDKSNGLVTVHRPFRYGKECNYRVGMEIFSFWPSSNFEIDIIERR